MPRTDEELRNALAAEEPDYIAISLTLDAQDAITLGEIARGDDLSLAVKATFLAGLLPDGAGAAIVANAAGSGRSLMRVTAASAARNLPPEHAPAIFASLLADSDPGVRKTAIAAVPEHSRVALQESLQHLADNDPVRPLAEAARQLTEPEG